MEYLTPKKVRISTIVVRITGAAYFLALIWNFQWVITNLNGDSFFSLLISITFLFAMVLVTISGLMLVINHWRFSMIKPNLLTIKSKPEVAVLIPTCGEPVDIVLNTLRSVTSQNWPKDKRVVVISDDGYNDNLEAAIEKFKRDNNEEKRVI